MKHETIHLRKLNRVVFRMKLLAPLLQQLILQLSKYTQIPYYFEYSEYDVV